LTHAGWVHVFDTENGQRTLKLRHGTSRVKASAVAWSPNGHGLASGAGNGLAEVWEVPTGRKVASVHLHTARIHALAWSPDGRRVASGGDDRTVRVWDPVRGEELLRFDVPEGAVTRLEWSPDGRRLAAASEAGTIHIWDASAGYDFVHSDTYYTEQVRQHLEQATQLWDAGDKDEAIALYEQTLRESRTALGPDRPDTLTGTRLLASAYLKKGRLAEAIALLEPALEKCKATLGPTDAVTLTTTNTLARAYEAAGRPQAANACYDAVGAYDSLWLALGHLYQGDKGAARAWYDRGVRQMERNQRPDEELKCHRDEIEKLLGLARKP
jgi:dipeptidyl aminopeptidase/acylaminoacyl peptidase